MTLVDITGLFSVQLVLVKWWDTGRKCRRKGQSEPRRSIHPTGITANAPDKRPVKGAVGSVAVGDSFKHSLNH